MPRGPAGSDRTPRLPSSARDRCARAGAPPETPAVCQARAATFAAPSAFTISRQNAGRSGGVRDEIRLPSTTTSRSTYLAPALITSSLIALTQVIVLPLTMPAEIGTQPAWQIAATTLPD